MGERLEIFIDVLGMKKKDFAEAIGLQQPNLSPYIGANAKLPKTDVILKIVEMGLNVHWWVTGEGTMYAENEAGRALQKKANAHNPERDDNIGKVLDSRDLMTKRVFTNVITEEEVKNLESLSQKLRSML